MYAEMLSSWWWWWWWWWWGGLDVGATQLIIDFLGTESSTFEAHTLILIPCMAPSGLQMNS